MGSGGGPNVVEITFESFAGETGYYSHPSRAKPSVFGHFHDVISNTTGIVGQIMKSGIVSGRPKQHR